MKNKATDTLQLRYCVAQLSLRARNPKVLVEEEIKKKKERSCVAGETPFQISFITEVHL